MGSVSVESLRALAREFVGAYADRVGCTHWWREPLLVTAETDDRFQALTTMANEEHLMPWDLLSGAKSLIVFFIPFAPALEQINRDGEFPARQWGQAYVDTNNLIGQLSSAISDALTGQGHRTALTPATHNFDMDMLRARWSHKHLAHISGLGRYGVHCQLITPSGSLGRLGSLVTDAELGDHPLVTEAELCLHKRGEKCLKCVARCPVGALRPSGMELAQRKKCFDRLESNRVSLPQMEGLPGSTHVCGKCASGVPCTFEAPRPERR